MATVGVKGLNTMIEAPYHLYSQVFKTNSWCRDCRPTSSDAHLSVLYFIALFSKQSAYFKDCVAVHRRCLLCWCVNPAAQNTASSATTAGHIARIW